MDRHSVQFDTTQICQFDLIRFCKLKNSPVLVSIKKKKKSKYKRKIAKHKTPKTDSLTAGHSLTPLTTYKRSHSMQPPSALSRPSATTRSSSSHYTHRPLLSHTTPRQSSVSPICHSPSTFFFLLVSSPSNPFYKYSIKFNIKIFDLHFNVSH